MLACQRPEVEIEPGSPVEPFIEEPEHPLGRRQAEPEVELEVELLEVAALEALEDHLVPAEAGEGQGVALGPGLLGPTPGGRLGGLARLAAGPLAALAVVERDVVQDVEILVDPALGRVVPPGVLVHQDDADPAVERLLDPPVARAALRPAQELDQLVTRERDLGVGEVAPPLGQLDQADQDLVVGRGRQAVLDGPHDGQSADDRRVVATLQFVFENERRLTVRDPIRQRGDREFCKIEFILPSMIQRRCILFILLKSSRLFNRQTRLFRLILFKQHILNPILRVLRVITRKNNNKTAGRLLLSFSLNKSLKQILGAASSQSNRSCGS